MWGSLGCLDLPGRGCLPTEMLLYELWIRPFRAFDEMIVAWLLQMHAASTVLNLMQGSCYLIIVDKPVWFDIW